MRAGWRWAVCAAVGGRPRGPAVRGPVCAGGGSRRRSGRAARPDAGVLVQAVRGVCGEHRLARPADDRPARRPQQPPQRPHPGAGLVAVGDRLARRHDHPGRRAQHPDDRRGLPGLGLRGQPGRAWPLPRPTTPSGCRATPTPFRRRWRPGCSARRPPTRSARSRPAGSPAGRPRACELQPSDSLSSVGRVDVWADSASGIPVLVEVFGRSRRRRGDVEHLPRLLGRRPGAAELAFAAPPGARVRSVPRDDLVRDIARSGGPRPPDTLLGFTRSRPGAAVATIGEYGRGRHPARGRRAPGPAGRLAARPAAARVRRPRAAGRARRRRRPGRAAADDVPRRRRVAGRGHRDAGGPGPGGHRARCGRLVIRTEGLTKRFGSVTAVDDVGLDVSAGDIYGFLGANGSGKTTTVRCLLGLVLPTAGHIELLGRADAQGRTRRAAQGGRPRRGTRRIRASVRAGEPRPRRRERPAARRALGWRPARPVRPGPTRPRGRRPGRGRAPAGPRVLPRYASAARPRVRLLRQPELLVLDEPTNGLDPQGIREVRTLLLSSCTRRGRRSSCPATCWRRSTSSARGSGCSTAAVSSCRSRCPRCGRRPGGPSWSRRSAVAAEALSGTAVRSGTANAWSSSRRTRPLSTRGSWRPASRVRELGPERQTLEQVIEERTSARRPGEVAR